MDKKLAGALGEYYAARYYRSRGYQIEAANYRTRQGEIDLVVSKDGVLVFSEVKLRAGGADAIFPPGTVIPEAAIEMLTKLVERAQA